MCRIFVTLSVGQSNRGRKDENWGCNVSETKYVNVCKIYDLRLKFDVGG